MGTHKGNTSGITARYLEEARQYWIPDLPARASVAWKSPSNIALVKYWGKRPGQIPENPSVSMTLSESVSIFRLEARIRQEDAVSLDFSFEGKNAPAFREKLLGYLMQLTDFLPYVKRYHFTAESYNTFPHSAGIASSAASMSAFSLCLLSIGRFIMKQEADRDFFRKASYLSRIGSGSACRSVYPGFVLWGETADGKLGNDEYGFPLGRRIHSVFRYLNDSVLIVSSEEKEISSSRGHALMHAHPFAAQRFREAYRNTDLLLRILQAGDVQDFIRLVESEALMLHGMIMSSGTGNFLIRPGTIEIINRIKKFRQAENRDVCFTLDAGPNIHLLYPDDIREEIRQFIESELLEYCENRQWIDDRLGSGPQLVNESYE